MYNDCESVLSIYLSIVSLEKRYKYRFIVSQILIQDTVLNLYLDTLLVFQVVPSISVRGNVWGNSKNVKSRFLDFEKNIPV